MGYNPNIPYLQVGYIPLIPSPLIQDETAGLNKASRLKQGFELSDWHRQQNPGGGIVPYGLLRLKVSCWVRDRYVSLVSCPSAPRPFWECILGRF